MKRMGLVLICLGVIAFVPADAHAQRARSFEQTLKRYDIRFEPAEARPGETVTLKITLEPVDGFFTYPVVQPDARAKGQVNRIAFPAPGPVIFVGPFGDPAGAKSKVEPILDNANKLYYVGPTTWERKAVVSPNAQPGLVTVALKSPAGLETKFQVCDEEGCFNSRGTVTAKLTVLSGPAVPVDSKYKDEVEKALGAPLPAAPKKDESDNRAKSDGERTAVSLRIQKDQDYERDLRIVRGMLPNEIDVVKDSPTTSAGFTTFLLTAMFWGLITLLTPCVFPMVPITVSFFLKQGEKKVHNPLTMALVYTLTIVIVLGVAALFFLSFFRNLSVNPWMNVALGLLFVFFALSLFGMYDITLPSFLVRFTSSREGRGGYGGVVFMALSFSIVSFTCVAPFLGGFAGMADSKQFSHLQLLAGALAFSGTFAAPFFVLALFPSLLRKMPKSGSWMNTIKVVMGFLELAAALKFFRTAELRWTIPPVLFTYDFVLAMWVVILFFSGLYLLSLYRLPHDEPQEHIGVPRMLFGFLFISIGLYLIPGLFAGEKNTKQRPGGTIYAWVDSFLLPDPVSDEWTADLHAAIEKARENGKVVFVDFTGVTCTNCKLNEKEVFPQPAVKELMQQYVLTQLYTDTVPPNFYVEAPSESIREQHAAANLDFQKSVFKNEQLPLYVLLKPVPGERGGPVQVIGVYEEGKINNVESFKSFLKKGAK